MTDASETSPETSPVVHAAERSRFEIDLAGGQPAVLTYVESGDAIVFDHTLTPPAHRGKGLADQLTRAGLTWAASTGKPVVPQCWYVAQWLEQHPGEIPVTVR
jgi:predicted GNAT family acetyltransferase